VLSVVRPGTLVALLVLGVLLVAASWVDAGTAATTASPDPHPSAKKSQAPGPDAYQPPASTTPSSPSTAPTVTETVTQPVIQVETTPATSTVDRTPSRPAKNDRPAARAQKKQAKAPERVAAPTKPRRESAQLAVPAAASDDGGPLLLGGIAMALLALASGSLLLLVTRATGVGRWEPKS
jgi:hypothetical protein